MGPLISIFAFGVGIAALIGCLLALIYAWDAWHAISRDLYHRTRPRWVVFRPVHLVALAAVMHLIVRICEWSNFYKVGGRVDKWGDLLCLLFLAWWFVWAVRIMRQKPTVDKELGRFAKFICCGTGVFIATIFVTLLFPRR